MATTAKITDAFISLVEIYHSGTLGYIQNGKCTGYSFKAQTIGNNPASITRGLVNKLWYSHIIEHYAVL